jgi:hypothetical protein
LLFIPDKQAGQPQVARSVVNKDVHHQNAFCHSHLRHIRHRGRAYENGYLKDFGRHALRLFGASLRLFKIAPGDFVIAEPNRWISVTAPVCAVCLLLPAFLVIWLASVRYTIPSTLCFSHDVGIAGKQKPKLKPHVAQKLGVIFFNDLIKKGLLWFMTFILNRPLSSDILDK